MCSLLFASTIVCFSGYFAPILIKYLISAMYSRDKLNQNLSVQIRNLEKEMCGISMVNEFARFTRLKRRYTKMEEELKQNVFKRASSKNRTQMLLTYGHKFISHIISLALMYMYGNEPVIILSERHLWPFENLLSWPGSPENAISLTMWIIITRLVVGTCK